MVVHVRVHVAEFGEARGHGRDVEVLRVRDADLLPAQRRGDGGVGTRPHRVGGGDGAVPGGLVVVDEDALAAFLLPPLDGHPVRHPPLHLPADGDGRAPHLGEGPARFDRHEDVQAPAAGGLGEAAQAAELVEDGAQFQGGARRVVVVGAGLRVEVDAQFVGAVDVGAAHRPGVEGEGAVLGGPQHRGLLGGAHLVGAAPAGEGDVRGGDPVGHALGGALLVEPLAGDAVRVALQGGGPLAQGAQDAGGDGLVVAREVELGVAALREEDLAGVGQPYGAAARFQFHRFAHASHGRRSGRASHIRRYATGVGRIGRMDLPVMPPVKPMLAKSVARIPPGMQYEAKWDGFRAIVFRDGAEVEFGSRTGKPLTRYFPSWWPPSGSGCPRVRWWTGRSSSPGRGGWTSTR